MNRIISEENLLKTILIFQERVELREPPAAGPGTQEGSWGCVRQTLHPEGRHLQTWQWVAMEGKVVGGRQSGREEKRRRGGGKEGGFKNVVVPSSLSYISLSYFFVILLLIFSYLVLPSSIIYHIYTFLISSFSSIHQVHHLLLLSSLLSCTNTFFIIRMSSFFFPHTASPPSSFPPIIFCILYSFSSHFSLHPIYYFNTYFTHRSGLWPPDDGDQLPCNKHQLSGLEGHGGPQVNHIPVRSLQVVSRDRITPLHLFINIKFPRTPPWNVMLSLRHFICDMVELSCRSRAMTITKIPTNK